MLWSRLISRPAVFPLVPSLLVCCYLSMIKKIIRIIYHYQGKIKRKMHSYNSSDNIKNSRIKRCDMLTVEYNEYYRPK